MPPLQLPRVEWSLLSPELVLVGGALLLLVAGTMLRGRRPGSGYAVFSLAVVATALVVTQDLWHRVASRGGGPRLLMASFTPSRRVLAPVVLDGFSVFFIVVLCCAVVLAVLLGDGYLRRERLGGMEYYVLVLISAAGGMVMASANDLVVVFVGLEILSISLYVLAGFHRRRAASQEAAIKYFVLGAFSSAFFLYGVALTYGATGSTNLAAIADFLRGNTLSAGVLLGGLAFLLVGLGFKVAAVPFHMWTPDVYQGAPTPVTGFMAGAAKAAGFAALLRIFFSTFGTHRLDWQPIVWWLAVLSLVVGSVLAIVQSDVKRMLAYSSISHAGYVLVGLQAASNRGIAGALFYLLAYTFMIGGSFAVVTVVSRRGDEGHDLDSYRGLASRRPGLAFAFTVFLLAQAGVPFTSGFLAKFYVISAAAERGHYTLAVVAMLAAVVAAFLYLRIIVAMYMTEPAGEERRAPVEIPAGAGAAVALALAFTVVVGFLPGAVLDFARHATVLRL